MQEQYKDKKKEKSKYQIIKNPKNNTQKNYYK